MPTEPKRMFEVLAFIDKYKTDHDGNSPTRLDIASAFGIARESAEKHLMRMLRKHLIDFDDHERIILVGGVYTPPKRTKPESPSE